MNIFKNLSKGVSTLSMIGILALSFGAQAETSDKYQQAAGFYRQMVGDVVVTAIYDGYIDLNPKHLSGLSQQQIQKY